MPAKKYTAEEKLNGRTNVASYRLGALFAIGLLDDKTATRLFNAVGALDAVQSAQSKLHFGTGGSENEALEKRLNLPIRHLKQSFVRQVDATMRKVDQTKLTKHQREMLQL